MISLIATVLNEGESIRPLMDSIVAQTRQPDEVVIVDGGSTDTTLTVIDGYSDRLPLRVIVESGCNISAGRNVAIREAQGDVIAATDAGVVLSETWLEHIAQPFEDETVDVVCGFFRTDAHTTFEVAMGATVLPLADEIDPTTFLPSSRSVAFRKIAWEIVGGYPEWLDFCEDLIFDLRLRQVGKFVFVPEAVVDFRPRGSLRSFYRQYYQYARGDGKADLWRKRHAVRYLTYLVALPGIFLLVLLVHPLLWLLYVVGGVVYLRAPYRRLPIVMKDAPSRGALAVLYAAALIPVIRVVGDVAKMHGYPVGWRWRLRHHPPKWKIVDLDNQGVAGTRHASGAVSTRTSSLQEND